MGAYLLDQARLDFVLDHLRHDAAKIAGAEILEVSHHPGRYVRAAARTSTGRAVAAIVVPEDGAPLSVLEAELGVLARALNDPPGPI